MWKKPLADAQDTLTGFRQDANGYLERVTTAMEHSSEILDLVAVGIFAVAGAFMLLQLFRELRHE